MPERTRPPADEPPEVGAARREFGKRLDDLRLRARFATLKELSEAANVSYTTLKETTSGKTFPSFNTVGKLVQACRARARTHSGSPLGDQAEQLVSDWRAVDQVVDRNSPRYATPWPHVLDEGELEQEPATADAAPAETASPTLPADHVDSGAADVRDEPPTEPSSPETKHTAQSRLPEPVASPAEPAVDIDNGSSAEQAAPRSSKTRLLVVGVLAGIVLIAGIVSIFQLVNRGYGPSGGASAPTSPAARIEVPVRFNALGGTSSSTIRVFAGVTDSPADRRQVGTYPDKEVARAICKRTGRTVSSETNAGEEPRTSDTWVLLAASSPQPMYATLTYADVAPADLATLPICP